MAGTTALSLLAGCGQAALTVATSSGGATSTAATSVGTANGGAVLTSRAATTAATTRLAAATTLPAAAKGTVTVWSTFGPTSPQGKLMPKFATDFNSGHSGLHVETLADANISSGGSFQQKVLTAVAGGVPPDAVTIDVIWPEQFATAQAIVPLDQYIGRDQVDLNDFLPAPLATCTVNGKVFALPFQTGTLILYYNEDLFKQAGLDPAVPPATWDDLLSQAQKLTKGTSQYGMQLPLDGKSNMGWVWHTFLWQAGGELLNQSQTQDTFNSAAGVEALQFCVDLVQKYHVAPPKKNIANAFNTGKVAMMIAVPASISALESQNVPFVFRTAVLPKKARAASNTGGWNWAMPKGAPNADGGWAWMNWATSSANLTNWNTTATLIAPRKSASQASQEFSNRESHWQAVVDTIPTMKARPKLANYQQWSDAQDAATGQAIQGKATVKDALDAAALLCDQVLAKEPKAG